MTIIYFILLLSVIVVVHEFGHFIVAKLFNVYCYEFSIGMGPKLWSKKGKETTYVIRALPVGGYVAMAGENDGMAELSENVEVPKHRCLDGINALKKICIMSAGIVMNFLLAWIIISIFFMVQGVYPTKVEPYIGAVKENSPAYDAGFEVNDKIIKVEYPDGTVIKPKTFSDLSNVIIESEVEVTYTILRDGKNMEIKVTPVYDEQYQSYMIGISSLPIQYKDVNILNAPIYGADYLFDMAKTMFISIGRLFRGIGLNQVSGPVGIYTATDTYVSLGFEYYLFLIALISLNVGIFNALPLPVLDGGRIFITIVEVIIHKKLNKKVEAGLMAACWALLICLMLYATVNDITRIIS